MAELVEVVVGRVGRAHGIRGEVAIDLRTDEPERRFAVGAELRIEGTPRTLRVAAHRWHGERLLVHFEGVPDRTAVEALRGAVLIVEAHLDERPDDEDEFYDRQLVGLRVFDHTGTDVGAVTAVVHLPTQDLLAVETALGERFVPFVAELVPEVDLDAGCLRLADVGGLLDEID